MNTARLLTEQFNAAGGIGRVRLNTIYIDEAGSTADKVAEFRRLVQDEKIQIAIGYTSSANCLAVAPLADELKTLIIFHVCANYRLFDKGLYKYVFRTASHSASENIAAALYVLKNNPNLKSIAGMNYDYAYGRDSWDVFKRTILKHKPDVQVVGELWTKFLSTEYSAEISRLLALKPDVIHTVNWGAGLSAFINQGGDARAVRAEPGDDDDRSVAASGGGAEGRGLLRPRLSSAASRPGQEQGQHRLSARLQGEVQRHARLPRHVHGAGFLRAEGGDRKGVKAKGGAWPTNEEIAAAMEGIEFETPRGP